MAYKSINLPLSRINELNSTYNLWPKLTAEQVKREGRWLEDKKRGLLFGQLETEYDTPITRTEEGTHSKFALIHEGNVTYINALYDYAYTDEDEVFVVITVKLISSEVSKSKQYTRFDTLKFLVQSSFWAYFVPQNHNTSRRVGIIYQQLPDPVYAPEEEARAAVHPKTNPVTIAIGISLIAILLFGLGVLLFT